MWICNDETLIGLWRIRVGRSISTIMLTVRQAYYARRLYLRSYDSINVVKCYFISPRLSVSDSFPNEGDRTVDQMVQAARSTKQNIAEGCSDGQTSMESELKLLGIARGSNLELLEDYHDYINYHGYEEWFGKNPRSESLHRFCREHSLLSPSSPRWMMKSWPIWLFACVIR